MKIDFEFDTIYGKFADSLYLPDDHTFTNVEIEARKQERLYMWLELLNIPLSYMTGLEEANTSSVKE